MSQLYPLLLSLALGQSDPNPPPAPDLARLREVLNDRQHHRHQSQAALLLVQTPSPEAVEIIRQGLLQNESPETFAALASALRLTRDMRFREELVTALGSGQALIRQTAAETLGELADNALILRLQALAEDAKVERLVRQAALEALGRSGRKAATIVLLDQLSNEDETLRQAAGDALAAMTGQPYGADLVRWRAWWEKHKDQANEAWLEERVAYQSSRARRVEGDLERARVQITALHTQLYSRLPAGDRLTHVQGLAEAEDAAVRVLAVTWAGELLSTADAVGQRALAELLLRFSHDGSAEVQRAAVIALGRVNDPRVFDRLVVLLQRGPSRVRAAAARSLAEQVKGKGPEAWARQRRAVPALQKALEDPALEVVVEAAEGLGTLGVPEAGPVLADLLRHPSSSVRQTAALALERVADVAVLDGLLAACEDPAVTVRFSLVGALGHAAGDGRGLTEPQRSQLTSRLEGLLLRDPDPGVRSRAATVLGECGTSLVLPTLWRRILTSEDARVQEKAWAAMVEIVIRAGNVETLHEWDRKLVEAKQGARRLQLLTEVYARWQKRDDTHTAVPAVLDALVQAQLEQGKWAAAFPLVREQLGRASGDPELEKRLRTLLAVGEQAAREGNRPEALRAVQEARPYLARKVNLTAEFEQLEKQIRQP